MGERDEPLRGDAATAGGMPGGTLVAELARSAWFGLAVIALFFIVGGGWAATAPLSGAVIAPGVVNPKGSRQTIQHLEGGIISRIYVRDGDRVAKGDILIGLEGVSAHAEAETLTSRLRTLAAREARLRAERGDLADIPFDHQALAEPQGPDVQAVIDQERHQLATRRASDASRRAILERREAQLEQQILGSERQLVGVRHQMALIEEEIESVSKLLERGLERKPRLLALKRSQAELLGTEGELIARIARIREAIGETGLQIINLRTERSVEIDAELAKTQSDRIEVEKQLRESLDRLSRTDLTAPVDGVVVNLRFKTPGGVIRPGEAVLDMVPSDDELIIDARLAPADIDEVHPGLGAHVTFPSYPQRHHHRIGGKVVHVSADSLDDERTGERFYAAKVKIDRDELVELAPDIELLPGLPADVFIATTERTFLDYLLQPFYQSLERSFRER